MSSTPVVGSLAGLTIPLNVFPELFKLAHEHAAGTEDRSWDYAVAIVFSAAAVEAGAAAIIGNLRAQPDEIASTRNRQVLAAIDDAASRSASHADIGIERSPQALMAIKTIGKHYDRPGILGDQTFQHLALLFALRNEIAHAKVERFAVFNQIRDPTGCPDLPERVWSAAEIGGNPAPDLPLATLFRRRAGPRRGPRTLPLVGPAYSTQLSVGPPHGCEILQVGLPEFTDV